MIKGCLTFDEFLNEKQIEDVNKTKQIKSVGKANVNKNNAAVVVHSQNPQKPETMYFTDKDGVKYEWHELKKEISGLPMDIFIGHKTINLI